MNPRVRSALAVLALSLVCLACGGGGGSSPTEPTPPTSTGKRFQFTVGAQSTILQGGVIEATVSVDGREVSRRDWSGTSGSCQLLCSLVSDVRGLSAGNHTVTFTVVRQTRTTVDYTVTCNGIVTHENGSQEVANLPHQRAQLRAGQSVSFNIRI
jgi:hypothetical protein